MENFDFADSGKFKIWLRREAYLNLNLGATNQSKLGSGIGF